MSARHATGDNAPINGWTLNTLKEHVLKIMDERDCQYQSQFAAKTELASMAEAATSKALALAERAVEKEFTGIEADICRLEQHIEKIEKNQAGTEGRHTGIGVVVAYVIGAIGIIIAIVSLVLRAAGF